MSYRRHMSSKYISKTIFEAVASLFFAAEDRLRGKQEQNYRVISSENMVTSKEEKVLESKPVPNGSFKNIFTDDKLQVEAIEKKSRPGPIICCKRFRLESDDATGWILNAIAANTAVMSNVFLASALLFLAKREIGCEEEQVKCGKIYGMKPSSLITVIGTVSGLLSAFFLPFIGAIIDYTSKRWECGATAAALFILIQAIQIGTVQKTWFAMAILQAFNGFFFQINSLCIFAYLPEIGAVTEREKFTWYNSLFSIAGFVPMLLFVLVVVAIGLALSLDDQRVGQVGQAIDVFVSGGTFLFSYIFLHRRDARNTLKEGEYLYSAGFKQVFRTSKQIYKHYPRSIGLFFLGIIFSDAAMEAFTTIAVSYLNEVLDFDSTQVGLVYIVVLVFITPGAFFASWLAIKTSPLTAIKINGATFIVVNFGAFLWLTKPGMLIESFICGGLWGFLIGMYYTLNKLIFSLVIPKGQEAELAGIWRYCALILGWFPPLLFTVMNESSSVHLKWGGISLNIFIFAGLTFFMLMQSWEDCLKSAETNKMKEDSATQPA